MIRNLYTRFLIWKEFNVFQRFGYPVVKEEKISKSYLKRFLPANPLIIDCGAHDGTDSVELVKVLGGKVFAFEPVPDIYKRLKTNTSAFENITCFPLALGNKIGKDVFYVSEGGSDASSSLLAPKDHLVDHSDTFFNKKIEVDILTLDDWALQNKISKIDLLWLDMQGFELQMLMKSTVILPTVKAIHTEVSVKETYEGVGLYKEYKTFLEKNGFEVVVEAIPANWDMGNVLFVKK